jgi:hypothetical protein
MRVWYRRCALAFQAREDRSVTGHPLQKYNIIADFIGYNTCSQI